MSRTLPERFDAPPRRISALRGESECRKPELANLGVILQHAFKLAHLEPKEVAYRLGYTDESIIYKWFAGTENPNMAKLLTLNGFPLALVLSLAQSGIEGIDVQTVVTMRRTG